MLWATERERKEQSVRSRERLFIIMQPCNPQWIKSRLLSRARTPCLGWFLPIFLPLDPATAPLCPWNTSAVQCASNPVPQWDTGTLSVFVCPPEELFQGPDAAQTIPMPPYVSFLRLSVLKQLKFVPSQSWKLKVRTQNAGRAKLALSLSPSHSEESAPHLSLSFRCRQ